MKVVRKMFVYYCMMWPFWIITGFLFTFSAEIQKEPAMKDSWINHAVHSNKLYLSIHISRQKQDINLYEKIISQKDIVKSRMI